MSEAQKYEGALWKGDKKGKNQKQDTQSASQALVPRSAYVEDAPDDNRVAVVDAPPHAPSPPPVNVFDFLVSSETPNASKVQLPAPDESRMIEDTQPPAETFSQTNGHSQDYNSQEQYAQNGFSYGTVPVQPSFERYESYTNFNESQEAFYTPAPKYETRIPQEDAPTTSKKSDKKRKRNHVEGLDMSLVKAQAERDAVMTDAPPVLHSGLTGGLNRLLTRPEFPPSPDYSGGDWVDASPLSPMKRTKQVHIERERGRDREPKQRKSSGQTATKSSNRLSGAWVRRRHSREDSTRESRRHRSGSDEKNPSRRRRRSSSSLSDDARVRIVDPPRHKSLKAIEYPRDRSMSVEPSNSNALVKRGEHSVIRRKAPNGNDDLPTSAKARSDLFTSFVTKGLESERGYSMNKVLKRYHRERVESWDRGANWGGMSKAEEEKELWKSLRLKRNDRGEVVLFFEEST